MDEDFTTPTILISIKEKIISFQTKKDREELLIFAISSLKEVKGKYGFKINSFGVNFIIYIIVELLIQFLRFLPSSF